jgi:glycosyltransferase involved in cell wall biosynthesis
MFNTNVDVFSSQNQERAHLSEKIQKSDIVFVADLFVEDYIGGAELTTENLINYLIDSGKNICKVKSSQIDQKLIQDGLMKHWIFCNYAGMNMDLIPIVIANLKYSIIEYDYKFCKYRSVEKHQFAENRPCDCSEQHNGKIISAFMFGALNLFWMSEKQRNLYFSKFPFLKNTKNTVLSSIFSNNALEKLKYIRDNKKVKKTQKAVIVGSNSWIKGVEDSISYCKEKELEYEVVQDVSHDEILQKMSEFTEFVFMPRGGDTCPRIVIEAKLAGLNIHTNLNTQHIDETWWSKSQDSIEKYLKSRPEIFKEIIDNTINKQETISGYTTVKDCIEQEYPYEQAIKSMLGFCDQVIVVDGGSTDGTWESLVKLSESDDRIIIEQKKRDWNHPRFAVFDGLQKAYARSLCTGDWCWQMDSDEVVHEKDYKKIKELIKQIPKSMHLLALPVIEYWGSVEKVRIDVNPWKWRLSRNLNHITHGIPKDLRRQDEKGMLYAAPGTDGCDYIDNHDYNQIPCMNFYTREVHDVRVKALSGDEKSVEVYENWLNNVVENLPGVHHYSWIDLERKIKTYKNYWSKHWQSLYNIEQEDTPENNMFFDKKWSDVTDEEIVILSSKLKDKMGGWIFHNKVDFEKPTPHAYIEREQPGVMK